MGFERFAVGGFSIVSMGEGVRFSFAGPLGDWSLPVEDGPVGRLWGEMGREIWDLRFVIGGRGRGEGIDD
jgi:hypothetical protein